MQGQSRLSICTAIPEMLRHLVLPAALVIAATLGTMGAVEKDAVTTASTELRVATARLKDRLPPHATGYTGVDFVERQLPIRQSSLEMANSVIEHATDPNLQAFAKRLAEQERENIRLLKQMQQQHGL